MPAEFQGLHGNTDNPGERCVVRPGLWSQGGLGLAGALAPAEPILSSTVKRLRGKHSNTLTFWESDILDARMFQRTKIFTIHLHIKNKLSTLIR